MTSANMKDKSLHTTQAAKEIILQRIKYLIIEKSSHIHKTPIMKVTSNIGMILIKLKVKIVYITRIMNTTIKILIINSLPRLIIENSVINSCLRNIINKIIGKRLTNRSRTLDFIHLILALAF